MTTVDMLAPWRSEIFQRTLRTCHEYRQLIQQRCVGFLAKMLRKKECVRAVMDKDVSYQIESPASTDGSKRILWLGSLPVTMQAQKHWYRREAAGHRDGAITVKVDKDGSTKYAVHRNGKSICLHSAPTAVEVDILEARLHGRPKSVFARRFPEGVDVTGLIRIPTYAKLTEILPSILLGLSNHGDSLVLFENPSRLYLSVLLDDTYEEVTFGHEEQLVV